MVFIEPFSCLVVRVGMAFVLWSARVVSRSRDGTRVTGNRNTSRKFQEDDGGAVRTFILNLGLAICVASYGFVIFMFHSVAFFFCVLMKRVLPQDGEKKEKI